jgi:hypothetical protein
MFLEGLGTLQTHLEGKGAQKTAKKRPKPN